MAVSSSTPSRRLTRSQTATTVLGKRRVLSRSSSIASNMSSAMLTPESTPTKKRTRTSTEEYDGRANKENIPPVREFVLDSPTAVRLSRRSSFSSDISTISTPSRNNLRRSTTSGAIPQTPATALNSLSLATPPPTPLLSTTPLYLRVRGLLRATSNANNGMSLEGRENERGVIESFLRSLDGNSDVPDAVLYVSGSPGTGKTALVNSIIASTKVASDVKILFINCMAITSMDALWEKLANELTAASLRKGKSQKKEQGRERVSDIIEKQGGFKCILVLDELDNLVVGSSNALQPLFALATSHPTSLRVLGIANTHTLTATRSSASLSVESNSTMLHASGAKSTKIKTIHFAPYSPSHLLAILNKRFEDLPQEGLKKLLPSPTLSLLTKKVAALTGDVRVLFEVLRGAIDNAISSLSTPSPSEASPFSGPSPEALSKAMVTPAHILSSIKTYAPFSTASKSKSSLAYTNVGGNSEIVTKVRSLVLQQRLVLLALVLASRRATAALPLSGLSSSSPTKTPASPTKRPRSPIKRTNSVNDAGYHSNAIKSPSGVDSSQLYSFYCAILTSADIFTAASRSEFTELLGILETMGLVALSTPSTRSFKRSSSFTGSAKACSVGGAQTVGLQVNIREAEVVRGLGIGAETDGEGDALEDELRTVWSREMSRIHREAKAKDTLATLEGIEGFVDAMED